MKTKPHVEKSIKLRIPLTKSRERKSTFPASLLHHRIFQTYLCLKSKDGIPRGVLDNGERIISESSIEASPFRGRIRLERDFKEIGRGL